MLWLSDEVFCSLRDLLTRSRGRVWSRQSFKGRKAIIKAFDKISKMDARGNKAKWSTKPNFGNRLVGSEAGAGY